VSFGKVSGGGCPVPIGGFLGDLSFTPSRVPFRYAGGVFDVADHRVAAKADYPKFAAVVGNRFDLEDDEHDAETHFRFPDGTRLVRGASVTPHSVGPEFLPAIGSPTIDGRTITITAGGQIAASNPADSAAAHCMTIEVGEPPASNSLLAGFLRPDGGASVGLMFLADGVTVLLAFPFTHEVEEWTHTPGDTYRLYRTASTGAWGVIKNGQDSSEIVELPAGFTGAARAFTGVQIAGVGSGEVTFSNDAPVPGYSPFNYGGEFTAATSDAGERGGSAETAGHALTEAQLAPHNHPFNGYQTASTGSGGWLWSVGGPSDTAIGEAGEGEEHAHGVDPEHVKMVRLVRVA